MDTVEFLPDYLSTQNAFTTRQINKATHRALEKKLAEDAKEKHYLEQLESCKSQINNILKAYVLHTDTCVDIPNVAEFDNHIKIGITYECYKDDCFVKLDEYNSVRGLNNITSIAIKLVDYLSQHGFTVVPEKYYRSLDDSTKVIFYLSIYFN